MTGTQPHIPDAALHDGELSQSCLLHSSTLPRLPVVEQATITRSAETEWGSLALPAHNQPGRTAEKTETTAVEGTRNTTPSAPGLLPSEGTAFGPFFLQRRVGIGGKEFTVVKLRTMRADQQVPEQERQQAYTPGKFGKVENDPRITPLGRVLRKYWIDEVPQLINILKGDMQLVGWRPLMASDLATYPDKFKTEYCREKPALISVLYASEPTGRSEVLQEAERYFTGRRENRLRTQLSYLGRAIWGVLAHGRRGV